MKMNNNLPKFNREKELERFFEMTKEFDSIEEIRKTMDKMTYLLPSEREKIENILFDIHIRTLKNAEWQRKILGLSESWVGNVEELIAQVEEMRKRVKSRLKEGKTKTNELFE
ncbi:MAG: hypothetical protein N3G74_02495 [Candidatus Micrarchaeota archaeon]|nr:hypothetical protein [Candidatus Micrarchaeota archaeon]